MLAPSLQIIVLFIGLAGIIIYTHTVTYLVLNRRWIFGASQALIVVDLTLTTYFIARYLSNGDYYDVIEVIRFFPLVCVFVFLSIGLSYRLNNQLIIAALFLCQSPLVSNLIRHSPIIELCATLGLTLMGFVIYARLRHEHDHTITVASIKHSFDALTDGLMYCAANGKPLAINQAMEDILSRFDLAPKTDLSTVWNTICHNAEREQSRLIHDTQVATCDREGKWWYFSQEQLCLGFHQKCIQLQAQNFESYVELVHEIEQSQEELTLSIEDAKLYLHHQEELEEEKLLLHTRAQLHDVLAQRISVIGRILEDGVHDGQRLREVVNLLHNIEHEILDHHQADVSTVLATLVRSFQAAGLSIKINGEIPRSTTATHRDTNDNHELLAAGDIPKAVHHTSCRGDEIGQICVELIREAATNALVHGDAHTLNVTIDVVDCPNQKILSESSTVCPTHNIHLTMSNDGVSTQEFTPGNGINGMRTRLQSMNGTLSVFPWPIFTIKATIPCTAPTIADTYHTYD